jgi:hypothetical protein
MWHLFPGELCERLTQVTFCSEHIKFVILKRYSTLIQAIEKLKQLTLAKDADFSQCLNCFLELTENDQFLSSGHPFEGDDTFFKTLLTPVCNFFGANVNITSLLLIAMKQHHLMHGSASLSNHKLVMFYYFEDIQCGMAAAAIIGSETHFFRITLLQTDSSPPIQ